MSICLFIGEYIFMNWWIYVYEIVNVYLWIDE